ncbi:MAG: glycosyl hydrolase family 8 [bacterium]
MTYMTVSLFPSIRRRIMVLELLFFVILSTNVITVACAHDHSLQQLNSLHELWNFYKYTYIKEGRVISWDENGITTSEGQSYAMLRAVWANDHPTFKQVYQWIKNNLMVRGDHLCAWKWKHDNNSAADADTDIALALLLAWKKFSIAHYRDDALKIMNDIWHKEVIKINTTYFLTAGDWAPKEKYPAIHVGYLAPYAYELFAQVDHRYPWEALVDSSYKILEWLFFDQGLALPPQVIFINKDSGQFFIKKFTDREHRLFSYDAFPLYWRIALDYQWHGRNNSALRKAMLAFFQSQWKEYGKLLDRYTSEGHAKSEVEALPLYATVHSLAITVDNNLAKEIYDTKLQGLWENALIDKETPYYLHNWLWFGRAFEARIVRNHLAFFDFIEPIDPMGFLQHSPWVLTLMFILLYFLLHFKKRGFHKFIKIAFLICGFTICFRYLWWRLNFTLNFLETIGPFISITLWLAEFYCLTTVILLFVQVGFDLKNEKKRTGIDNYAPSVDVYIPIYSESMEILEKTLVAACAMHYQNKAIFILDDSHRESIENLAIKYGVNYIKGPRHHAKAGNLNNALAITNGELIVVFDTDHIPVSSFLDETVPFFSDPNVGVVQTPHHFYNQDIFQRAFRSSRRVPNEQDMFNHGIQGGRDNWSGAFFVGSGAMFRRKALECIDGFKLMSITEDIHSSQHLHAKGYTSVFLDKDLAVGLAAEDYASYIVQRKRWMQGCLQIFFKNNPLFQKGLGLRHRFGYFASLYYFFFPVIRLIFWITPLYYLLFHLHPIFSDVSILLAYLIPYMICVPLLSSALLQRWPRMFWGVTYENAVCFPLFLSIFELVLPRTLAFKVTPKGITSDERKFDFSSSWITLIAAAITLFGIVKGIVEFNYFGIEKDAYFFNLGWAIYNLIYLLVALLVAWERPQKRQSERINMQVPFKLRAKDFFLEGTLHDISLTGASFVSECEVCIPPSATLELFDNNSLTIAVRRIYQDRRGSGKVRCGLSFTDLDPKTQNDLLLRTFAAPQTWQNAHVEHTRSNVMMGYFFFRGIISCFLPTMALKRKEIRHPQLRLKRLYINGTWIPALMRNRSADGRKLFFFTTQIDPSSQWQIREGRSGKVPMRSIYLKKIIPNFYVAGFKICESL